MIDQIMNNRKKTVCFQNLFLMSKIGFPTILHLQTRSLLSILPICSSKLTLTRYSAVKPHIMA